MWQKRLEKHFSTSTGVVTRKQWHAKCLTQLQGNLQKRKTLAANLSCASFRYTSPKVKPLWDQRPKNILHINWASNLTQNAQHTIEILRIVFWAPLTRCHKIWILRLKLSLTCGTTQNSNFQRFVLTFAQFPAFFEEKFSQHWQNRKILGVTPPAQVWIAVISPSFAIVNIKKSEIVSQKMACCNAPWCIKCETLKFQWHLKQQINKGWACEWKNFFSHQMAVKTALKHWRTYN